MSYLAAWIVTDSPPSQWAAPLVDAIRELRGLTAGQPWSWAGWTRSRGGLRIAPTSPSASSWPRLERRILSGELSAFAVAAGAAPRATGARAARDGAVMLTAEAELVAAQLAFFPPERMSRRLFPDLPDVLESERQPRTLSLSVHRDAIQAEPELAAALGRAAQALYCAARGAWAHVEWRPAPPSGPLQPPSYSWHEVKYRARTRALAAADRVILGPGQVEDLGGAAATRLRLARFAPADVACAGGHLGLSAAAAPESQPATPEELGALAAALEPIALGIAHDPPLAYLLVTDDARGGLKPDGLSTATLADGTVRLDVNPEPVPRTRSAESARHAELIQRADRAVPDVFGRGRHAAPLYLPRLLDRRSYVRLGPTDRAAGLPAWDSGEPFGEALPILLSCGGQPPVRTAAAYERAVGAWAARLGRTPPAIAWSDDGGRFEVPSGLALGEPLLLLLLALDRAAMATRRSAVDGIALAPVPSAEAVLRRFRHGEPAFLPPA